MFDSPIDRDIQAGLKMQAKYASLAILSSQVQADHPPISADQINGLADIIYTCLYSFHYCDKSPSAEKFLRLHLSEMEYAEWEPELIGGVGE